ncbi:MAG: chromate transporter [Lentihominibacter sp.]|jgi:chromate transporter
MSALITLFLVFFKIGLFSFGGGNAMLPLIYQSVQEVGVMTAKEFSDMVALSQVTPGPVAINAATYAGLGFAGIPGAIVATIGVSMPCFIIMLIVIRLLDRFNDSRYVKGAFVGIRPVTIGLIAAAVVFIADDVLVKGSLVSAQMADIDYYNWVPIGIFAVSILLTGVCKIKPVWIMLIMAAAGSIIYGFVPEIG